MLLKKEILLLLFILFSFSCKNDNKNVAEFTRVNLVEKEKRNLVIDDFFALQHIVPLATNDSSLIINIAKVFLHNENIILFDNFTHEILHYDTTGSLQRKIANLGKGPGEYLAISDLIVDFDEKIHYVLDGYDSKKVIKYTLEGEFISEYRLEFGAASFYKIDDNSFVFYGGNSSSIFYDNDNFNNLIYTDSLFKVKSSAIPINKKWDGYAFTSGGRNTFFYETNEGQIKFIPQLPSNMDIYNLGKTASDATLHTHISFKHEGSLNDLLERLPREEITNTLDKVREKEFTYNMHNFMENKKFTFFSVSSKGNYSGVLIDRSNKNFYYEINNNDKKHGSFRPFPIWNSEEKQILVNILSPHLINTYDFELGDQFKNKIDADDNPVLVFYEFKK